MAPVPDENTLILEAKAGNEAAFGRLYELYFERIYKFIYFRVNHKEVAEDLAEEVFVKAWMKIRSVQEKSFGGWLFSISKNIVIDHYRQRKSDVDIEEIQNLIESDHDVADDTNTVLERATFIRLLKQLTPEQQIIIKLKFLEDMDNAEIAELISKNEGAIRVIQHRAITKLQELLEQEVSKTQKITGSLPNNISRKIV